MSLRIYYSILLLFTSVDGCCFFRGKNKIREEQRLRLISEKVQGFQLSTILFLHVHAKSADFAQFNLTPEDIRYFRGCVAEQYEENKEELVERIVASYDNYRKKMLAPQAQIIHQQRKERRRSGQDQLPEDVQNFLITLHMPPEMQAMQEMNAQLPGATEPVSPDSKESRYQYVTET